MTATRSLSSSLQHMGRTLLADDLAGFCDAELVCRFVERRDEAAFGALVRRYGTVVFGVCRRVLRHEQDAEDAFQATFLVLARNAKTVRQAEAIGNWLYGVAYNVARKAKAMRHRREEQEREAAERTGLSLSQGFLDDLREILDEELHALPDKYRVAVVLCDLRGLTIQQAANEVGCPAKTLGSRLSRGRARLAARLTRRGVVSTAAALPAALATCANASVPPRLLGSTLSAATGSPAEVSPTVATLTEGVTNVLTLKYLKYVSLSACGALVLAGFSLHIVQAAQAPRVPVAATLGAGDPSESRSARPIVHSYRNHLHHFFTHVLIHVGIGHGGGENVAADDKKDDKEKLSGTWIRKDGELKIDFAEKDALTITPHGENKVIVVLCEYTRDKDGLVKAKITGFDGKEAAVKMIKEKLPVGTEFTFKWTVKDAVATLEELKDAKEKIEIFKSLMEGEYGKK